MDVSLKQKRPQLTGVLPFPHLSDWTADGALFALQALKGVLSQAESSIGSQFVAETISLPFASWRSRLLHPAVFAFVPKEPGPWEWSQLIDEVTRDGDAIRCGDTDLRIWANPGPQFTRLLKRLGRGSRGSDCARASFIERTSSEFDHYATLTHQAIRLLECATPGFATDVKMSVHAVAFVDEGASFRGSSGIIHRGLVLLSPDESWDVGAFAEELLHEATHNLLDLFSLRMPLLIGPEAFEERYSAPFRPDPRHLYGNLHALVVVARLAWLFKAFEGYAVAPQHHWQQRRKDYIERALPSLSDVRQYGNQSNIARIMLEEFVVPTLAELRN